jgi:hypothetical protein
VNGAALRDVREVAPALDPFDLPAPQPEAAGRYEDERSHTRSAESRDLSRDGRAERESHDRIRRSGPRILSMPSTRIAPTASGVYGVGMAESM